MLLPLTILIRESASEPPVEKHIGLNPYAVARVEDGLEAGTINIYADQSSKPYVVAGTVEEFVEYVNELCGDDEEEGEIAEECEPPVIDNE